MFIYLFKLLTIYAVRMKLEKRKKMKKKGEGGKEENHPNNTHNFHFFNKNLHFLKKIFNL
jgi:hypothetical protein